MLFVPPKNDWALQSTTNWNEGKSKHKRSDTWGHRKRHFNILQTEWISMRFSTGSYNIQVKVIRSCRQLKVVPKKYNRLSVNPCPRKSKRSLDQITRQDILVFLTIPDDWIRWFDRVYGIIDYNNINHAISIENNEY